MPIQADGVTFDTLAADPTTPENGQRWHNSTLGEPRVRRGGVSETMLTPPSHNALDTLTHGLLESCEVTDTRNADGRLTARVWRLPGGGVTIRRVDNFTFDATGMTGYRVQQMDGTGSPVQTLTASKVGGVWQQVLS